MNISSSGRVVAVLAGAVPVVTALASPSSATRTSELRPGSHPAANVNADGRVVYHYDRANQATRNAKPRSGSPDMTNHGGVVIPAALTQPIFWGTTWNGYVGDKISGLNSWYTGFSGSNYARTTTEYSGTNGVVTAVTSSLPNLTDVTAASGGSNSGAILSEVARALTAAGETPPSDGSGYYPVCTDIPRGNAGYCAYNSAGTIGTTRVQFAFFWKLDGDAGCNPQDTSAQHSQGLAALANVSGHELADAMTDPASPGAWYDGSGNENGDKCAWTFGAPLASMFHDGLRSDVYVG